MRTNTIRLSASAIALLASIAFAKAQPAPSADPHHPATQAQGAGPMTPPTGGQAGPGMGMMGGNMDQMMRMMQSMQMMDRMMPREGSGMAMMPGQHIEGRIAFLKTELGITEAQLPQWNAFADAMRESARSMQAAMTANMGAGMPTTAIARSDAMIAMMTARLESMKKVSEAGKALYAVLTDAQKKSADELMMSRMGMGMGGR